MTPWICFWLLRFYCVPTRRQSTPTLPLGLRLGVHFDFQGFTRGQRPLFSLFSWTFNANRIRRNHRRRFRWDMGNLHFIDKLVSKQEISAQIGSENYVISISYFYFLFFLTIGSLTRQAILCFLANNWTRNRKHLINLILRIKDRQINKSDRWYRHRRKVHNRLFNIL